MKHFLTMNAIGIGATLCAVSATPALAAPTVSNIQQVWGIYEGPPYNGVGPKPMWIPSVKYSVEAYVIPDTTTQNLTVTHSLTANSGNGPYFERQNWQATIPSYFYDPEGTMAWRFVGRPYVYEVEGKTVIGYYGLTGSNSLVPLEGSSTR